MIANAYWISPNGKIKSAGIRHINDILDNPKMFGLTSAYIKKVQDKYPNERLGQEGNAREEIMIRAMQNGWVRARQNRNSWILQAYTLNKKTKDNIWDFIKYLVIQGKQSKYSDVTIGALHPEYYTTMNFEDVIRGNLYESNEYISKKNKIVEAFMELFEDMQLKKLISNSKRKIVTETKLGKVWKYISDKNSSFGIVSAFSAENSREENERLSSELLQEIRQKYGYIMLKGGFVEKGKEVIEESFFIPKITRDDLIQLGKKYNQYSVIYKDAEAFVEIGTNSDSGVGKILNRFSVNEKDNLVFNKELIKNYFSSLMYGPHAGRKFLFKLKERESASLNRVAYNKNELKWNTILEENYVK